MACACGGVSQFLHGCRNADFQSAATPDRFVVSVRLKSDRTHEWIRTLQRTGKSALRLSPDWHALQHGSFARKPGFFDASRAQNLRCAHSAGACGGLSGVSQFLCAERCRRPDTNCTNHHEFSESKQAPRASGRSSPLGDSTTRRRESHPSWPFVQIREIRVEQLNGSG